MYIRYRTIKYKIKKCRGRRVASLGLRTKVNGSESRSRACGSSIGAIVMITSMMLVVFIITAMIRLASSSSSSSASSRSSIIKHDRCRRGGSDLVVTYNRHSEAPSPERPGLSFEIELLKAGRRSLFSGVHKGGFSKRGFSNLACFQYINC